MQHHIKDDPEARSSIQAELKAAREEIESLRRAYAELTRSRDRGEEDAETARAILHAKVAAQTKKIGELNKRASKQESRIDRLAAINRGRREALKILQDEAERYREEYRSCCDVVEKLRADAKDYEANRLDVARYEELLDARAGVIARLRSRGAEISAINEDRKSRISHLQKRVEELKNLHAAQRDRISQLKTSLTQTGRRVEEASSRCEELGRQLSRERQRSTEMLESTSWKVGNLIVRACRRPGVRTIALPIHLFALALRAWRRPSRAGSDVRPFP